MHIRLLTLALLALVVNAAPVDAQFRPSNPAPGENYHVELGAIFWNTTPGIVLGSPSLNRFGQGPIDFVQALTLDKARFTEFRGVVKGGKHKLRVSRVPINYSQTVVPPSTVTLGGRTFAVTRSTTGEFDWDLFRFGYEYDFGQGQHGYVGFIAEVKYNRVTADLRVPDLNATADVQDVKVPAPQLGIVGRVYPHKYVSITGEFTGFKVPGFLRRRLSDADTFEADFKDFEVNATVSITRFLGLQGGYRSLSVDYVVDDETGDLQMKGPYFGGMIRF
jgi:hypothetical protein